MKTKHEKKMRMELKETNKISKSSQTKKKWRSNLSNEKLEDKIEKTFQFKVIFQNKTGKTQTKFEGKRNLRATMIFSWAARKPRQIREK